ncbi:hypothetical protein SK128_009204 [Halocaridina rubra]|uniref:Reverse transcriptase domain-containing protein n=1 Tax=Halocaridina rubra TaxID=373956 RepID=A0AAN8WLD7_HALRR
MKYWPVCKITSRILGMRPFDVVTYFDVNKLTMSPSATFMLTSKTLLKSITKSAKFFTIADALHGYWQMELTEEDRHLTTFITPKDRFKHCRGPMGDAFSLRGDMQGITN